MQWYNQKVLNKKNSDFIMPTLDRRRFLRAAGTTMLLPAFASLGHKSYADSKKNEINRMVCLAFGWGVTKESWYPDIKDVGQNYKMPKGLKPLEEHRKDFSVFQGLLHQHSAEAHWGSTFLLTGANRYAVPGKSFHNTISMDQVAAKAWGAKTRYTSLQFDCKNAEDSGHGPGLSLSWSGSGKPIQGLSNPFLVYQKLFGNEKMSVAQRKKMIQRKGSSLDAILSDAKSVRRDLSHEDKDKLDEYLHSIRDIELQLAKEEAWVGKAKPKSPMKAPKKGVQGYQEIKIMYDLIVAALQTDSTRVITYRQPVQSLLKSIGISISAHNMSHYNNEERTQASMLRDQKQSELLAYFFRRMKSTKDINGKSLFENTTITYGSNIQSLHYLHNVPTIVAGNTRLFNHGSHYTFSDEPLCNLWLSLLNANKLNQASFGDSTGMIDSF